MKRLISSAICAVALAAVAPAHAGPIGENAVSVQLTSLDGAGLSAQYERQLRTRFSVLGAAAARVTAAGDYSSYSLGVGVEGRFWLTGQGWPSLTPGAMAGPYVFTRLDLERTALDVPDGGTDRAAISVASSLGIGYRLLFWDQLELSAYATTGVRVDAGGGPPTWRRGQLGLGFTLGWLF